MVESSVGLPEVGGASPVGKGSGPAAAKGGSGDAFAQTLQDKQRDLSTGGADKSREAARGRPDETTNRRNQEAQETETKAKKTEERGEQDTERRTEARRADDDKAQAEKTRQEALRKADEGDDGASRGEGGDEGGEEQAEAERLRLEELRRAAEEEAEAAAGENPGGKELPAQASAVAAWAVTQAGSGQSAKAAEGESDTALPGNRRLDWLRGQIAGDARRADVDADTAADDEQRLLQAARDQAARLRPAADGLFNESKGPREGGRDRGGEAFLRSLQQARARDGTTPQPTTGNSAAAPQQNNPSTASGPVQLNVPTPVNQQGWDQALGERVQWMAKDGLQEARLQLSPRHLGPIEVRISVNNDQASVNFTAHHALTRDAIEQAMPRLREMLAEQGLDLAQSNVSDQGAQGREQAGEGPGDDGPGGGSAGHGLAADEGDPEEGGVEVHETVVGVGGLDYYA